MTTQNYNEKKEQQAKTINVVLQSVQENDFPKVAKKQVKELAEYAIHLLSELQAKVYKEMNEEITQKELIFERETAYTDAIKLNEGESVSKLQNQLSNTTASLISELEKEAITSITNGTDVIKKTREFRQESFEVTEILTDLNQALFLEDEITEIEPEIEPEIIEETED